MGGSPGVFLSGERDAICLVNLVVGLGGEGFEIRLAIVERIMVNMVDGHSIAGGHDLPVHEDDGSLAVADLTTDRIPCGVGFSSSPFVAAEGGVILGVYECKFVFTQRDQVSGDPWVGMGCCFCLHIWI